MWNFRELSNGELEHYSRESEFFKAGNLSRYESLVRESVQNSLDNKMNNGSPVLLRYSFDVGEKLFESHYLNDLTSHLKSARRISEDFNLDESTNILTIEDFNTTGLDGTINRNDLSDNQKSNYINFWLREGKSDKTGKQAGRWGLGKTVFHAASELQSFWGLTIRSDDSRELLLGKALIDPHSFNNKDYNYYGYFSEKNSAPIEEKSRLKDFKKVFGVTRNGEFGLSVVIPQPVKEINPETILGSAIVHYFYPISQGTLEIEVIDASSNIKIKLDKNNLSELVKEYNWEDSIWKDRPMKKKLVEFIEQIQTIPKKDMIKLSVPNDKPEINETSFGGKLTDIRSRYDENKFLWFHVPISIKPNGASEKLSYFYVYLLKDNLLEKPSEYYIRAGISILEIEKIKRLRLPLLALLSAEDLHLSSFLGDCETPAHTDWKENDEEFKEKYEHAVRTLRFIKNSMQNIIKVLEQSPPGLDKDALKNIFYIDKKDTGNIRTHRLFDLIKIHGGFSVVLSEKDKLQSFTAFSANIKIAFAVRRGSPYSNYHPVDFDLNHDSYHKKVKNGSYKVRTPNTIDVYANRPNFKFQIKGFDPHRDLVIDISKEKL